MISPSILRAAPQIRSALAQSSRQMSVLSGPPQVRISFAEKLAHGLAISAGILAVPAWVLVNIKNYRSHE